MIECSSTITLMHTRCNYTKRSLINLKHYFSIDLNQWHYLDYTLTDDKGFTLGLQLFAYTTFARNRWLLLIVPMNLPCHSLTILHKSQTTAYILIESLLMFKYFKSTLYFTIIFELLLTTVFQGVSLQSRSAGICVTFEPWFLPRFLPRP